MKASSHFFAGMLFLVTALCLFSPCVTEAATWQGGNGDWVSDNWGLIPPGSPGDAVYTAEPATVSSGAPGTIQIKAGDSINMGAVTTIASSQIVQAGGLFSSTQNVTLTTGSTWTINDGTWSNSAGEFRIQNDAILYFNGGTFTQSAGSLRFNGNEGTVVISGGSFSGNQVRMDNTASAVATLRVVGSDITTLQSAVLAAWNTTTNPDIEFIFDDGGIKPWTITGGGNSFALTDNNNAGVGGANLFVNVSALLGNGVTGSVLFDYGTATRFKAGSAFNEISIFDAGFGGNLTLGTFGSLGYGEYFLDYGMDTETYKVTLYYNTIPEPGTWALLMAGMVVLCVFGRRRFAK